MRNIILGTDWWTDCDDAAAIRILCKAHKRGEIKLLGIIINACAETSVKSLSAFLGSEGVHGIPIGIDRSAIDFSGTPSYHRNLCALDSEYSSNDEASDGAELYGKLLSECEGKAEIIEIGYLQTAADFIEKNPELAARKIKKIWCMAGKWDEKPGKENNFSRNRRASDGAYRFCKLCPAEITFFGYEAGEKIISGSHLNKDDVLFRVFADHHSESGRSSWDPMTAMLMLGRFSDNDYELLRGTAEVDPENGENSFAENPLGKHSYVKLKKDSAYFEALIDSEL